MLDSVGPSSPQIVASVSNNVDNLPVFENPLSPKATSSNSKTPGSPKARRPTNNGDGKSSSSDEGPSKRSVPDGASSPQESKKRRMQRSTKPRKP